MGSLRGPKHRRMGSERTGLESGVASADRTASRSVGSVLVQPCDLLAWMAVTASPDQQNGKGHRPAPFTPSPIRMTTLNTDRLILRPFTLDDFESVAAMFADPEVMQFIA